MVEERIEYNWKIGAGSKNANLDKEKLHVMEDGIEIPYTNYFLLYEKEPTG